MRSSLRSLVAATKISKQANLTSPGANVRIQSALAAPGVDASFQAALPHPSANGSTQTGQPLFVHRSMGTQTGCITARLAHSYLVHSYLVPRVGPSLGYYSGLLVSHHWASKWVPPTGNCTSCSLKSNRATGKMPIHYMKSFRPGTIQNP